jgi:rod shape-determining protein MreC
MESVVGRYRNLMVLVGVLFAQVLGLAVQVKRASDTESSRLIRVWVVGAISPLEKVLVRVQTSTGNIWHNYFYLRGVRAENRALKQEIERMRLEQVRLTQDADQAHRLQLLLGFRQQFISQTLAAQVIGSSGSEQSRAVYIDKGENARLRPDMAVITPDGIVGKVLYVYPSTSLVLLINDQSSGVGAILEKTRTQGILRGTPTGEVALERVVSDETVNVGALVLTSGGDRIFPKGLVVGRVAKVSHGNDSFLTIRVKPGANLARLEEVLVVTKIDERQSEPAETAATRAADVLAARLPSVPVKAEPVTTGAPATTPAPSGAITVAKPLDGAKPRSSTPPAATGMPAVKKPAASLAASPVDGARPKPSTPVAPTGMQAVKKPAVTSPAASPVKAADKPVKPAAEKKPPAQDAPH